MTSVWLFLSVENSTGALQRTGRFLRGEQIKDGGLPWGGGLDSLQHQLVI